MFVKDIVDPKDRVQILTTYVLVILLSTLLLKFFWNKALVPHITVFKPLKNFQDAIALSIGLMIIRGC